MRDGEAARLCGCSELAMAVCLQVRQADRSTTKASIGTHCSPPPIAADILLIGGYLVSGEVRYEYWRSAFEWLPRRPVRNEKI
jgi:hypothetical protein